MRTSDSDRMVAKRFGACAILLFALLGSTPVLALADSTSISLSPSVGPPTSSFSVIGLGFGAGETVIIKFDGSGIGKAIAGSDGSFSKQVSIPASAPPGDHTVTAKGRTSGLSASATFTVRTDWPKFHFDLANSGFNPYENVLSPSNVSSLNQAWAVQTRGYSVTSPAVVGGTVYGATGTADGTGRVFAYAIDGQAGTLLWRRTITSTGNDPSAVTYSAGKLFVGTIFDHAVRALDPATGAQIWKFVGGGAMNTPVVSGGILYVGSADDYVYALNSSTGRELWKFKTHGIVFGAPAIVGDTLYVGSGDRYLYSLDPSTGTMNWRDLTDSSVVSSPAVVGGVVYVASQDSYVYAFDAGTGALIWSAKTGGHVESSPAVAYGRVYVGSEDSKVYAFDASTGVLVWKRATGSYIAGESPVVANGVVYIGGNDAAVHAFDASSGTLLWSFTAGDIVNDGAVADGTLYFGSFDGNVYAFRLP